jgi:hypothetical protein
MSGINQGNLIHVRRHKVAALRLRGMTEREVHAKLSEDPEKDGLRNPQTNNPYSIGTIHNDCVAIQEMWRQEMIADLQIHRAREVAELREARRSAWQADDLGEVRLNISLEADLLGTKELPKAPPSTIVNVFSGNVGDDDV